METKKKILVVDDETQIVRVLRQILTAHDYTVRSADDGAAGLELFVEWQPDLVLADLQMPTMDGLELCRRIRTASDVPIVILSVRDEEETIVEALDAGADDYVTKPFGTSVLLARLRSAFRRAPKHEMDLIEVGDFIVDVGAHIARLDGTELRLTPKEFDLLACFLRHPDRVLTHSFLLQKVWGNYYADQSDALRVLVGSLRKKIERDPSNPHYIQTEPWIGYRFIVQNAT
jgi:two-component system KDP operon response regulator KdpE